jgi:hypothetical protein
MTLLPASFGAQRREPELPSFAMEEAEKHRLVPEEAHADTASPTPPLNVEMPGNIANSDIPEGSERSTLGAKNLNRLSIGNDGLIYWDNKLLEVKRRMTMSRGQVVGMTLLGIAAVIVAVSASIHGAVITHDWMCRTQQTTIYCPPAAAPPAPPARVDIPT